MKTFTPTQLQVDAPALYLKAIDRYTTKHFAFSRHALAVLLFGLALQAPSGDTLAQPKRTIKLLRKTLPIPMENSELD